MVEYPHYPAHIVLLPPRDGSRNGRILSKIPAIQPLWLRLGNYQPENPTRRKMRDESPRPTSLILCCNYGKVIEFFTLAAPSCRYLPVSSSYTPRYEFTIASRLKRCTT